MGDAAHAMVPFYGQGMNAVSDLPLTFYLAYILKPTRMRVINGQEGLMEINGDK